MIQPQVGIEPVGELADRSIDVGCRVRHCVARCGDGVAQRLPDQQVAVLAGIVTQLREAPQRERHHRNHEESRERGGQSHPVARAQPGEHGLEPRSPAGDEQQAGEPYGAEQPRVQHDDQGAAHQQGPRPPRLEVDAQVDMAHATG